MRNKIQELIRNLYYYSEFEYLVNLIEMTTEEATAPEAFLYKRYNAGLNQIKEISTEDFFKRFYYFIDQHDRITLDNAKRFIALQHCLIENFESIRIFRIEKSVKVPILIVATNKNRDVIALETFSEET